MLRDDSQDWFSVELWAVPVLVLGMLGWQNVKHPALPVVLAAVLIALTWRRSKEKAKSILSNFPVAAGATAIMSGAILIARHLHGPSKAVDTSGHAWAAVAVFPFALVAALVLASRSATRILQMCTVGLIGLHLWGLAWQRFAMGRYRGGGLSHNVLEGPILCGMVLVVAVLSIVIRCTQDAQSRAVRWQPRIMALTIALVLTAIVVADSRAAVIAGVLALALSGMRLSYRTVTLSLVAVAALVAFRWDHFVLIFQDIPQYARGEHNTSLGGRFDAWRWSWEHWHEHPWFGIGASKVMQGLSQRSLEWKLLPDAVVPIPHLHNDVLQLLMSYGVIALACYFILWVALLVRARKEIHGGNRNMAVCLSIFCILALAVGQADVLLSLWTPVWMAWNAMLGVLIAAMSMPAVGLGPEPMFRPAAGPRQ